MQAVPLELRDGGQPGRWQNRFDGLPRMAASAVRKFGPKPDTDRQPKEEPAEKLPPRADKTGG